MSENKELEKAILKISEHYDLKHIVRRAFINGIFTASGLFIGAILVFVVATQVLNGVKEVPLLDTFLRETRLDIVIESQINEISGKNGQSAVIDSSESYSNLTYTNSTYNFSFDYPVIFSSTFEGSIAEEDNSYLISLRNGKIYVDSIDIYINHSIEFSGSSYTEVVNNNLIGDIEMYIFEEEITIDSVSYPNPTIIASFEKGGDEYVVIVKAKESNSAIARELLTSILQSVL
ncbi:MAG: hypothetical protein Q9M91_04620 [Candidatus Dojkabacteria bacterium]|nr:hypothetical protein [Candidatus Dojkabacteria bacterium]MDQ7021095.1 hypothetical protein [Candidatus Dojkabacteria bacterium]